MATLEYQAYALRAYHCQTKLGCISHKSNSALASNHANSALASNLSIFKQRCVNQWITICAIDDHKFIKRKSANSAPASNLSVFIQRCASQWVTICASDDHKFIKRKSRTTNCVWNISDSDFCQHLRVEHLGQTSEQELLRQQTKIILASRSSCLYQPGPDDEKAIASMEGPSFGGRPSF